MINLGDINIDLLHVIGDAVMFIIWSILFSSNKGEK